MNMAVDDLRPDVLFTISETVDPNTTENIAENSFTVTNF